MDPGELTWRRPSPTERSRTLVAWPSGRRAALRPCWQEDGHPPPRPSNGRAARSGNERFLRRGRDAWDSTPDWRDRESPGVMRRRMRRRREMKTGIISRMGWQGLRCDTFFHSDGSEARQEMAATIQQFPRLPWWRSRVLMPSTNRRGSLQISWGESKSRGDQESHCDNEVNYNRMLNKSASFSRLWSVVLNWPVSGSSPSLETEGDNSNISLSSALSTCGFW